MEQRHPVTPIAGAAALEALEVAGPDRERLLHGLVTGEVRGLAPGAVTHGFVTSHQGRILADYLLAARPESFALLLPRGTAAAIAAHLEKYCLASRVEIRAQRGQPVLELRGTLPEELLESAAGGGVSLLRDPAAAAPRYLALAEDPGAPAAVEEWARRAEASGQLRRASEEELELARIEAGELRFGIDFGGENFPQETGRDTAVSYTKGCYLGQEIVARIHYRGGVQKRPCALRFDGPAPPPAGTELRFEGRPVGRATSVATSPRFGAIGIGILHQRGAAVGSRLELETGQAEVVALPFVEKS